MMPTETVSWQILASFDFLKPGNCEILSIAGNVDFLAEAGSESSVLSNE